MRPKCTARVGTCVNQVPAHSMTSEPTFICNTMAECQYKRPEPDVGDGYEVATERGPGVECRMKNAPDGMWILATQENIPFDSGLIYRRPKRPSLPDGYELVPETVTESVEGLQCKYKHSKSYWGEWMHKQGRVLEHSDYWYCRPIQKDCDAEFEKWWYEHRHSVSTTAVFALSAWRAAWAARGKE